MTDVIETLCGILMPGALYPYKTIKEMVNSINTNLTKKLQSNIRAELRKSMSRIEKIKIEGKLFYRINPIYNFEKETKIIQSQTITGMANIILKMVNGNTKKSIDKWIETEFESVLERAVEKEFSDEVLPILLKNIDEKILKATGKEKTRDHLLQILQDAINKIEGDN